MIAAIVGIAAALLAYAISPAVRREVGHAEHSVRHTVTNIFDHDHPAHRVHKRARTTAHGKTPTQLHALR